MKKLFVLTLISTALVHVAQAQEHAPTKEEMHRVFVANEFASTLFKSALPSGANLTPDSTLGYDNDRHEWFCHVGVTGASTKASATETDPISPERACVQAVLQLARQHVI